MIGELWSIKIQRPQAFTLEKFPVYHIWIDGNTHRSFVEGVTLKSQFKSGYNQ